MEHQFLKDCASERGNASAANIDAKVALKPTFLCICAVRGTLTMSDIHSHRCNSLELGLSLNNSILIISPKIV